MYTLVFPSFSIFDSFGSYMGILYCFPNVSGYSSFILLGPPLCPTRFTFFIFIYIYFLYFYHYVLYFTFIDLAHLFFVKLGKNSKFMKNGKTVIVAIVQVESLLFFYISGDETDFTLGIVSRNLVT